MLMEYNDISKLDREATQCMMAYSILDKYRMTVFVVLNRHTRC